MPIQKVLVVDDSKTELMFLTDLLQKKACKCARQKTPKKLFVVWLKRSQT